MPELQTKSLYRMQHLDIFIWRHILLIHKTNSCEQIISQALDTSFMDREFWRRASHSFLPPVSRVRAAWWGSIRQPTWISHHLYSVHRVATAWWVLTDELDYHDRTEEEEQHIQRQSEKGRCFGILGGVPSGANCSQFPRRKKGWATIVCSSFGARYHAAARHTLSHCS